MVKSCCYGTCKSDTRYPDWLENAISFIPFPKPTKDLEKCMRWIPLCGRPQEQLNVAILQERGRAKHIYVCTKHFKEGQPTQENPDPEPALSHDRVTPARRAPKQRLWSEPPRKKARIALTETFRTNNSVMPDTVSQQDCNGAFSTVHCGDESTEDQNGNSRPSAVTSVDMLALSAENESLKQQMAKLILEYETKQAATGPSLLSMKRLCRNSKKDEFSYYTGLKEEQFSVLFEFLVPEEEPFTMSRKLSSREHLSMEDQLLLVMIKLRQNVDFQHIGNLFGISQQDASTIFTNWIQYMFFHCGSVPIWPHRDIIIEKMPERFREEFPNTLIIIDGTEIKIQRPSSMTRQSQCYSDYKSCNTLKGLVGVDPRGSIIFASMLFAGSIWDKELTVQSGFLDILKMLKDSGKIQEGDGIMADKGFRISQEIESLGLKLNIPPFARSGSQLSMAEKTLTEKIARHRVHVERAISRVKNFKVLSHRIDLSLFGIISQIWFVCCFVTNFMGYLIK